MDATALGLNEEWSESSGSDDDDMEVVKEREDESEVMFALHNAAEVGDILRCNEIVTAQVASALANAGPEEDKEALSRRSTAKLLERKDPDGCTPLHCAVLARRVEAAKWLIDMGTSLTTKCNNAPLIHLVLGVACIEAHKVFAEELLEAILPKLDPETMCSEVDELGRTALHLVAEFDLAGCAKKLLGANPSKTALLLSDASSQTVIHRACQVKSLSVLIEVLAAVNDPDLVDKADVFGTTPLHMCASNGFSDGFDLLVASGASKKLIDKRGRTTESIKCYSEDVRATLILSHEVCMKHFTCPPSWTSRRGLFDVPSENINRLKVLLDQDLGILRSTRLSHRLDWSTPSKASIADVLRVHDYSYVDKIRGFCAQLEDEDDLGELDGDTTISKLSFDAALYAAGSVCDAIDAVVKGTHKNAFCAVRPPGHHAGPRGVVTCENDPHGSFGFCLLSNAAIGAAYARNVHRHQGVKKVAIIDFDVHHGNGTEACVKNLVPTTMKAGFEAPFCDVQVTRKSYKPWLNEEDGENVFFASIHGYGKRVPGLNADPKSPPYGMFYPSDGKNFGFGEHEKPAKGEALIVDVGQNSKCREEWRSSWRVNVLPALAQFEPDLIIISAGFDAHKLDDINMGYISAVEHDYYWLTQELVKIANLHSKGRVVSILEGGYKIQGKLVSPFARSVYNHVAALVETSPDAIFDHADMKWEEEFENELFLAAQEAKREVGEVEPDRKRPRRNQEVDYVALNSKLNEELANGEADAIN